MANDDDRRCHKCGHPSGPHVLAGYDDDELGFPVEGWMTCPVEGCDCRMTWSIPEEQVTQMRALRRAN